MTTYLIVIGAFYIILYVISTIMIYHYLAVRNQPLKSFLLINLYIFQYVEQYKAISRQEIGHTGILFYTWVISINIALLCFILLMIFSI